LVAKEDIELKETFFGENKSNNEINGHLESNNGDLVKHGDDEEKKSS
jgi:hypothetical protein